MMTRSSCVWFVFTSDDAAHVQASVVQAEFERDGRWRRQRRLREASEIGALVDGPRADQRRAVRRGKSVRRCEMEDDSGFVRDRLRLVALCHDDDARYALPRPAKARAALARRGRR